MCQGGAGTASALGRLADLVQSNPTVPTADELRLSLDGAGPTGQTGIELVAHGNGYRVAVTALTGPARTIAGLAAVTHLTEDRVWSALQSHTGAMQYIWSRVVGTRWPGMRSARRRLRADAQVITAYQRRQRIVSHQAFHLWPVVPDPEPDLVLPLTTAFHDEVLDWRLRQRRTTVQGLGGDLMQKAQNIERWSASLTSTMETYQELMTGAAGDAYALRALLGLLDALVEHPKAGHDDLAELQGLKGRVESFNESFQRTMVLDPPRVAGDFRRIGATEAARLRELLEDPETIREARALVGNRPVISGGEEAHEMLERAVGQAMGALSRSPACDDILDDLVEPMLSRVADDDLGNDPTLLDVMALVPSTVGNVPGPSSLAVATMEVFGPRLVQRLAGRSDAARRVGDLLLRVAGMRASTVSSVRTAMQNNRVGDARQAINSEFQAGPGYAGAATLINLALLVYALRSDESDRVAYWGTVAQNLLGTAASIQALTVALADVEALAGARLTSGLVRVGSHGAVVAGAQVAGFLASLIAAGLSLQQLDQAIRADDTVGAAIAGAGLVGSLLSAAGFLVALGAGSSATGVGAPPGAVLMAIGAVLGIGAGIAGFVRSFVTEGSEAVFGAYWDHIGRVAGPLKMAVAERAALNLEWQQIKDSYDDFDWWDVHPDLSDELEILGFPLEAIAAIVNEDEDAVRPRLAG